MAAEVACRPMRALLLLFRRSYGNDALLAAIGAANLGPGIDLPFLENESNWLDFDRAARLLDALVDASGDPEFAKKAGRLTATREVLGFAYTVLKAFGSPSLCYKKTLEISSHYNRVGSFTAEQITSTKARFRYRSDRAEPNRQFCDYRKGQFESFPQIWGLPPAQGVERTCQAEGAEFCTYEFTWVRTASRIFTVVGLLVGLGTAWALGPLLEVATAALSLTLGGVVGGLFGYAIDSKLALRDRDRLLREQNQDVISALEVVQARFQEVQRLNATLESKVESRTTELHVASERLARSLAQQVELDKLKTQFFQNISHELRTPLTLILAPLETLLAVGHPPKVLHELETIHRSGLRLLKNINALLDLSRLDAGRERLRLEDTDVSAFLGGLVDSARGLAVQRFVDLSFSPRLPLSPFPLDRDKFEKIALNLISNALKFSPGTPERRSSVEVNCGIEGLRFWMEVTDSGVGMPLDQLERIFDRFHQVDGSLSRSHEGTGIGLSLVKEFVQLHLGEVKVRSQLGVGTTFRVELPMEPSAYPADATDRRQGSVPVAIDRRRPEGMERLKEFVRDPAALTLSELSVTASPTVDEHEDLRRPLVLLVDDNRDMLHYLSRWLAPEYRVRTAEDGVQALEVAEAVVPAIILSDVMMPKMSGQELLRRLRENVRTKHVPVIFVTARAEVQQKIEGLDEGADDYLTKPFNFLELKARIRSLLAQRQLERELQEKKAQLAKFVSQETIRTVDRVEGSIGRGGIRQRVTVLFSDVRGFTSFAEGHQPEEVVSVLNQYLQAQAQVVQRHGGDIDKFIGDELMARFVGPDAERRAARCAVEIVDAVDGLVLRRQTYVRLKVGVGVHVGDVILGAMGSEHRMDFTVTGDAVNVASRICSAAPPSQALISSAVREAMGDLEGVDVLPAQQLQVRGKQAPIEVFQLVSRAPLAHGLNEEPVSARR